MFKKINRAYEILSDGEKRQVYDQQGLEGLERYERYCYWKIDLFIEVVIRDKKDLMPKQTYQWHCKSYIWALWSQWRSKETYIVRSVEEQELKMAKLNLVPSVMAKVWPCRKSKLALECKCKCKFSVIGAKAEERLILLTVLTARVVR